MVVMGLLLDDKGWGWVLSGVALSHVPRLCMKGVAISLVFSCMRM